MSGVNGNHTILPSRPATSAAGTGSSATAKNYSFQYDDGTLPSGPALNPPPPSSSPGGDAAPPHTVTTATAGMPLHERLNVFRQSPFGDTAQTTPSPLGPPPAAAPAEPIAPAQPTPAALPAAPALSAAPGEAAATPRAQTSPGAPRTPTAATPPAETLPAPRPTPSRIIWRLPSRPTTPRKSRAC